MLILNTDNQTNKQAIILECLALLLLVLFIAATNCCQYGHFTVFLIFKNPAQVLKYSNHSDPRAPLSLRRNPLQIHLGEGTAGQLEADKLFPVSKL